DGGTRADLQMKASGHMSTVFADVPSDVTQVSTTMVFGPSLINGGVWGIDDQPEQSFPAEKPAKPHLYQGHPRKLTLRTGDGREIRFALPEHSFLHITDYREWGLKKFGVVITTPFNRDKPV